MGNPKNDRESEDREHRREIEVTEHKKMEEGEMRGILEDLARHGPPSARVAAIRVLRKLNREERDAEDQINPFATFDPTGELYDVELNR